MNGIVAPTLKNRKNTEALDERVCIQLQDFPKDSGLIQEYNAIKGYLKDE